MARHAPKIVKDIVEVPQDQIQEEMTHVPKLAAQEAQAQEFVLEESDPEVIGCVLEGSDPEVIEWEPVTATRGTFAVSAVRKSARTTAARSDHAPRIKEPPWMPTSAAAYAAASAAPASKLPLCRLSTSP